MKLISSLNNASHYEEVYENNKKFAVFALNPEANPQCFELPYAVVVGGQGRLDKMNNWNWVVTNLNKEGYVFATEQEAREKLKTLLNN